MYLLSDPEFLLEYMASDDSDDDFNWYLLSDKDPELDKGKHSSFFILYFFLI